MMSIYIPIVIPIWMIFMFTFRLSRSIVDLPQSLATYRRPETVSLNLMTLTLTMIAMLYLAANVRTRRLTRTPVPVDISAVAALHSAAVAECSMVIPAVMWLTLILNSV